MWDLARNVISARLTMASSFDELLHEILAFVDVLRSVLALSDFGLGVEPAGHAQFNLLVTHDCWNCLC
jgi:hypothetical protein